VAIVTLGLCLSAIVRGAEQRWPAGQERQWPAVPVPKLTEPFAVDGRLDEWASGLAVPSRSKSLTIYLQGGHKWLGPDDASMECYAAWNAEGVCAAVAVSDNELVNEQPPETPWNHDCVRIVVEARPGGEPAQDGGPPPGVRLLIVPPLEDTPAVVYNDPSDVLTQITFKARRRQGGFAAEVLVPWSLLGDAAADPGTPIALRFSMLDYDRRAGDQVVPFGMTWHPSWRQSPHRRPPGQSAPAVLVEELARSADADLESEVFLDVENCPAAGDAAVPIRIDLGVNIGREAGAVELLIDNWRSERVLTKRVALTSKECGWGYRRGADYSWSLEGVPYGQYTIVARVLGPAGDCLGTVRRGVLIVRGLTEEALGRIEAADVPRLAASRPFLASDWLAAAANLERVRQVASWRDLRATGFQARELEARLALLESGAVPATHADLFDLLMLTADPEAQVTVEFSHEDQAHVSVYWGAVPIGVVHVRQAPDEDSAQREFKNDPSPSDTPGEPERKTLGGMPAKLWHPSPGLTTVEALSGGRILSATSPSAELAERAVAAVTAGAPISFAQTHAFRLALAKEIEEVEVEPLHLAPEAMRLFVGDVHMHTIFSDGSYSPVYMALQTFCASMDFAVITDHNCAAGAQLAEAWCRRHGFGHSVIVGEEMTMSWAHLNAYPLRELVDWTLPPYEVVRSAHAQGAVVHWSHPTEGAGEWTETGFAYGLGPLGVEAWEHVPPAYDEWREEGRLPVLVGSTDEHMGYFFNLERSIILAPGAGGVDVAEAIRRGNVCIIEPTMENVVYGAPHMIGRVREALLEGTELRTRRAARVRAALSSLDIAGLIHASGQRRVTQEQADELLRAMAEADEREP